MQNAVPVNAVSPDFGRLRPVLRDYPDLRLVAAGSWTQQRCVSGRNVGPSGRHGEPGGAASPSRCARRIRAYLSTVMAADPGGAAVLNAFRHQRKDHVQQGSRPPRCMGAQRLSASTEGSPSQPGSGKAPGGGVLNAFRHQRKDHPRAGGRIAVAVTCSTPFGINGRITRFSWA